MILKLIFNHNRQIHHFQNSPLSKGVKLTKKEILKIEKLIYRNPAIPFWDIVIKPSWNMGVGNTQLIKPDAFV